MTREDAKREILFAKRGVMADSWIDKAYDLAISALEQSEIIHCQECKHHHYKGNIPYCDNINYGYGWKDDDFCSYAERKTDE